MKKISWIYPIAGFVALVVIYLMIRGRHTEPFFGMSPGTLTQLQSSAGLAQTPLRAQRDQSTHVPKMPAPGLMPDLLLVPQIHRFKPWASEAGVVGRFGAENAVLEQTPMPYLIY